MKKTGEAYFSKSRFSGGHIQTRWHVNSQSVYPNLLHPLTLTDRPAWLGLQTHDAQGLLCVFPEVDGHCGARLTCPMAYRCCCKRALKQDPVYPTDIHPHREKLKGLGLKVRSFSNKRSCADDGGKSLERFNTLEGEKHSTTTPLNLH